MPRTIAICYETNRAIPHDQRRAADDAYSAMRMAAVVDRRSSWPYTSRELAKQCRALIAVFGVRRAVRQEITEAQLAEARVRLEATIAKRLAEKAAATEACV